MSLIESPRDYVGAPISPQEIERSLAIEKQLYIGRQLITRSRLGEILSAYNDRRYQGVGIVYTLHTSSDVDNAEFVDFVSAVVLTTQAKEYYLGFTGLNRIKSLGGFERDNTREQPEVSEIAKGLTAGAFLTLDPGDADRTPFFIPVVSTICGITGNNEQFESITMLASASLEGRIPLLNKPISLVA